VIWIVIGLLWRRLLVSLPLLFVVSVVLFVILRALPTDPISMLVPPTATKEDVEELRKAYGFDKPVPVQYVIWLEGALRGDLGLSTVSRTSVTGLISSAAPATVELVLCGIFLGCLLGLGGGLVMYTWRGRIAESATDVGSTVMMSFPEFLWALVFVLCLGVWIPVLPFIGRINPNIRLPAGTGLYLIDSLVSGNFHAFSNVVAHLTLPVMAVALPFAPGIMRVLRSSLLDVGNEEYVRLARLRGIREPRILLHHMLRNALLPTLSLIGVQAGFMFGGTLLVEIIFAWPGMGNLMVTAVRNQDLPLIQGIVLTYCIIVLVLNMLVDASYLALNPKLRSARVHSNRCSEHHAFWSVAPWLGSCL
jgi:ABC-type dipeptide/oligopeptide/nickel transport system permease component